VLANPHRHCRGTACSPPVTEQEGRSAWTRYRRVFQPVHRGCWPLHPREPVSSLTLSNARPCPEVPAQSTAAERSLTPTREPLENRAGRARALRLGGPDRAEPPRLCKMRAWHADHHRGWRRSRLRPVAGTGLAARGRGGRSADRRGRTPRRGPSFRSPANGIRRSFWRYLVDETAARSTNVGARRQTLAVLATFVGQSTTTVSPKNETYDSSAGDFQGATAAQVMAADDAEANPSRHGACCRLPSRTKVPCPSPTS
jgi:hypothetical protein